ncbi:hypothetical protein EDB87DRAFT_1581397 [Lactarius vividus]|nr:hypothetical protein EDB87DRAFT_1581397 [Lactarius vividus]
MCHVLVAVWFVGDWYKYRTTLVQHRIRDSALFSTDINIDIDEDDNNGSDDDDSDSNGDNDNVNINCPALPGAGIAHAGWHYAWERNGIECTFDAMDWRQASPLCVTTLDHIELRACTIKDEEVDCLKGFASVVGGNYPQRKRMLNRVARFLKATSCVIAGDSSVHPNPDQN